MPQFLFVDHPTELLRIPDGDAVLGIEPEIGYPEMSRSCDIGVLRGGTTPQGQAYGPALDALGLASSASTANPHPFFKHARQAPDRLWIVSTQRTLETMVAMLILEDALLPDPVLFPRPRTRREREAELLHCRNRDPGGVLARIQAVDGAARFLRGEIAAWPGPQGGFLHDDPWLKRGFPSEVMDLAGPNQLVSWSADPAFPQDLVLAALRHWLAKGAPAVLNDDDPFDLANQSVWENNPPMLLHAATTHARRARTAFVRRLEARAIRPVLTDTEKAALLNLTDETVPPALVVRTGFSVAPVVALIYEEHALRRYAVVPFHDRYFDRRTFLERVASHEAPGPSWRVTHPREPLGNALVSPAGARSAVGMLAFIELVETCCR